MDVPSVPAIPDTLFPTPTSEDFRIVLKDLRLFRPIQPWLITAAWISLCVNALQLASPIYMLQIYDRVLVSRSIPTLLAITLIEQWLAPHRFVE